MNASGIFSTESKSRLEIWQMLHDQDLVNGELPPASSDESSVQQAWYIRVMLGFAGWLGALFLVGFVGAGLQFVMKSASAEFVVGIICCGVAYAIFKAAKNNDFVMQFGLAISMAGQGIFVLGLFTAFKGDSPSLYFIALVFQLALTALMPNVIHRFLTTAGAAFAGVYWLQIEGASGLAHGLIALACTCIWLSRRLLLNPALWRPVAYGLTIALLFTEGGRLYDPFYFRSHGEGVAAWWIGSSLVNLAFVASAIIILQREKISMNSPAGIAALVACSVLSVATYFAPGLSAALLLILIGFASGNRVLTGIGLFALLGFISHYYYQMQSTLLVKATVLAVTALMLLSMRVVFHRLFPEAVKMGATSNGGAEHA